MLQLTQQTVNAMLRVVKHRLDDELEMQGEMAAHIGREVARQEQRVKAAQETLDDVEARLRLEFKERLTGYTVPEIGAKVQMDPDRKAAVVALHNTQREYKEWVALYDAWKQRSHALTNLAKLHGTDYYAQQSPSITDSRARDAVDNEMASRRAALRGAVAEAGGRARVRLEGGRL